jgi:BirA family biotin operon repressor/biotin-[acetyl-CoA-carboxylase] ligase
MQQAVPSLPRGMRFIRIGTIDSTNAEAMRMAAAGEAGPLWIRADTQTFGRGRSGRTWTSVPGNLYASLLMRLPCSTRVVHQLSLVAGVAVVDAIRDAAATQRLAIAGLRLKWPNDVLIDGAKLAGILPESTSVGTAALTAVVGIGVNLAGHPADIGRAATHLAAHGPHVDPETVLGLLALSMQTWLDRWDCGAGFATIRAAWLERSGAPGEQMSVNTGQAKIEGTFAGIDSGGALLLRDRDGVERRFTYGDVTLAGATPGSQGDA